MRKGFTLIELIVVIAIIAILAAIIAPNAFRAIEKAKASRIISEFKSIKTASMGFYADTGKWPVSIEPRPEPASDNAWTVIDQTHPLLLNSNNWLGWDGPYLENQLRSPSPIVAISPGCNGYGHYYTQWWDTDWAPSATGTYYGDFDLDKNPATGVGGNEVTRAWSITVFPLSESIRRNVNLALDGDNSAEDASGQVKVTYGCLGMITLYGSDPL